MKTVIVIPAYNETRTIRALAQRTLASGLDLAVIDDGSVDGTAQALAGLPLTLLRHETNRGKAAALATGFAWALSHGADAVVTLDGDGQHSPEDIARLIAVAKSYPNRLVIAARLIGRRAYPRARNFANAFAEVDAIVAPVSPFPAFKIGEKVDDPIAMYLSDIYTITGDLAGIPCMSVPCGKTAEGLPVGMQILAKHFDEARMFRLADAFERAGDAQN